jgi:hypothetical protein
MLGENPAKDAHERYRELCALSGMGTLTSAESSDLHSHLDGCAECREFARQFFILKTYGIPHLAAAYDERQDRSNWDDVSLSEQLLERVRADQEPSGKVVVETPISMPVPFSSRISKMQVAQALLAACLVIGVGLGAYHLGAQRQVLQATVVSPIVVEDHLQTLVSEKSSADELLGTQAKKIAQLQEESAQKEAELAKLRITLRSLTEHSTELETAASLSAEQLRTVTQQRETLTSQLQEANQTYQSVRSELASLRSERDKTVLRTNTLEAKIDELTNINRDQEHRLKDAEQYLVSDRDIRELMGARKLYIADVFDVDSGSRTRKPFGRVFYTQGKSLIFYAFDLDHQPGAINANTFQVWGQKETAQGEQVSPMNLGILYMDNESNRRWALRFDDPKELAEIDAVFVTVEPRGGSQKPTTKPFLYALLRNEVNHP